MYTCVICRYAIELDDAITPIASGRCICLRCFGRETQTTLPMPNELRRALVATLAATEAASAG
jgi:hypothetical protein